MSTLVERLRAEAERLSGSSIRNGCPDCGIAANVAEEAADALSARPTPPAEIVRYEPMVQPFRGEDVVTMAVVNFGQWVRYEDHAVALAAERAARKEAEALIVTLTAGDPTKWTALDHPKGDAA